MLIALFLHPIHHIPAILASPESLWVCLTVCILLKTCPCLYGQWKTWSYDSLIYYIYTKQILHAFCWIIDESTLYQFHPRQISPKIKIAQSNWPPEKCCILKQDMLNKGQNAQNVMLLNRSHGFNLTYNLIKTFMALNVHLINCTFNNSNKWVNVTTESCQPWYNVII